MVAKISADEVLNKWILLARAIFLFDTSSLPDNATIDSATLSLCGQGKDDGLSITPDINIYSSAPASNTVLAAGDFDSLGSTAFSTAITYANYSAAAYNNFILNSSGIANISKTGVSKFGTRNANYDVSGTPPTWTSSLDSYLRVYFADEAGTAKDPKLVVTYTTEEGNTGAFFQLF